MKKVARFEIEEVVPLSDGIVAVLTLVDEDWDELPPIVAQKCPECGEIVGDFEQHDCCRGIYSLLSQTKPRKGSS